MDWFTLAFVSMLLMAAVNIISKHIMDDETHDAVLASFLFSVGIGAVFTIWAGIMKAYSYSLSTVLVAALTALAGFIAYWSYFHNLEHAEVSRFAPFFGLVPVFLLVFEFFVIGERLPSEKIIGVLFVVFGTIGISFRKSHLKAWLKSTLAPFLLTPLFFAVRNILFKLGNKTFSAYDFIFWLGIATLVISIILLVLYKNHLLNAAKNGVRDLASVGVLEGIALFLFILAMSTGAASMVSAVAQTASIVTFLVAAMLSKWYPWFIKEELTRQAILQKSFAILLVIIGIVMIT